MLPQIKSSAADRAWPLSVVPPLPRSDMEKPARPTFARLYQDHARQVVRWATRLGGPGIEAEDIVQEVFLIAHRQLDLFRGDSLPSTWLFGITQNVVRHRRRKDTLRRWLLATSIREGEPPIERPTPIEEIERRESTQLVYRALDGLRDKYRSVFILFEIDGLSGPEISALTGLPPTTLRVQLFRARALFETRLRALTAKGGRS